MGLWAIFVFDCFNGTCVDDKLIKMCLLGVFPLPASIASGKNEAHLGKAEIISNDRSQVIQYSFQKL